MYAFPKKVTLLITAKQNVQYRPAASLRYSTTQLLLFRLVAFHHDMKFIAALFFFRGFSAKQQKKRNHYSVTEQNALSDNYMENIIKCSHPKMTGQNDRQDKSLTGQAHDQAGHGPLTGRYFEPWHGSSQTDTWLTKMFERMRSSG